MPKIIWKAPKSVYKKLDDSEGQIRGLIKQRESKSLKNVFTSSKKLNDELNKKLASPVKEISSLFCHHAADSSFSTLCLQIDEFLQSYKKKYGVNVFIKVPSVTRYYQIIQKNVDILDKIRQDWASLRDTQLPSIRTCIQTCQEKFSKESKDSCKNSERLNRNLQTLTTQLSEIERREKIVMSLATSPNKDAQGEREKFQAFVADWRNNHQTYLRYFNEYKTTFGFFTPSTVTTLENIYKKNENEFNTQLALLDNSIRNVVMLCAGQDEWSSIANLSNSLVQKLKKYSPPKFDEALYTKQSLTSAGQNSDRLGFIIVKADDTFLHLSKTYTQICTSFDSFQLLLKSDEQSMDTQKNINSATEIIESLRSQMDTQIQLIQERIEIYEKNLNRSIDVYRKHSENINAHLQELQVKNRTVLQYQSTLTITQGTYSQYFTKDENGYITSFAEYSKTWTTTYDRFIEVSKDFSTTLSNYSVSEIIDELHGKIETIRKESSSLLAPLEKSISTCSRLLSEKKYENAKSMSDTLIRQAQNCKFTSTFDPKKIDKETSDMIDKTSESLSFLNDSAGKHYSTLSTTFRSMDDLYVRVQRLQVSLQTRIDCQSIFVFDKHASNMDENSAENLKRRSDTSKLQSVFDIVFNDQDIKKQNLAPYVFGSAAWVLIDSKGSDFKESRLKMPYTKKDDFQKDLRALYNK